MPVKYKDNPWGKKFTFACVFTVICLIGMSIACAGLGQLPICKSGDMMCYFFFHSCGSYAEGVSYQSTCYWVQKLRCIEGHSTTESQQMVLPFVAVCMAMVPGCVLIISTVLRNMRILFSLIEIGKAFMLMSATLLISSIMQLDELTWDCRSHEDIMHGNFDACVSGFYMFCVGCTMLLISEAFLLFGLITYGERERTRVRKDAYLVSVQMGVPAEPGFGAEGTQTMQKKKVNPTKIKVGSSIGKHSFPPSTAHVSQSPTCQVTQPQLVCEVPMEESQCGMGGDGAGAMGELPAFLRNDVGNASSSSFIAEQPPALERNVERQETFSTSRVPLPPPAAVAPPHPLNVEAEILRPPPQKLPPVQHPMNLAPIVRAPPPPALHDTSPAPSPLAAQPAPIAPMSITKKHVDGDSDGEWEED